VPSTSDKSQLRKLARATRKALHDGAFAARLAAHAGRLGVAPDSIVAGYHARDDEADPSLLLQALSRAGARIAFPRVTGKNQALEFHLVPEGEILMPGAYGVHEPLEHWPRAVPDLVLAPLLAFDDHGYRLGYGGGHYDRTLAVLPKARAIGIAYAGQRMDFLPRDAHDYPLDAILTEDGLTEFPR
jgi:5-formyltetrahydrofolate cyclo-ligase